MFQHTAARRRLADMTKEGFWDMVFQHTAARRRLAVWHFTPRPARLFQHTAARRRLGSRSTKIYTYRRGFNTQPPEGGWSESRFRPVPICVSTHSRPKAAGDR